MGGCCSVSLSCDQCFNQVTQCLCLQASYIYNIEKNVTALESAVEELKAKRNDLSRMVEREEYKGLRRLDQIQVWLSKVETIESQVNDLFSVRTKELKRLCCCGFCSNSLRLSYSYGKKVLMMLDEVENLKSKGDFDVVAVEAQVSEVVERPIQSNIFGQELMLETAWNHLIKDEVGLLSLYGMGGVGKTTLLKQINNKFLKEKNNFNAVIWIVVSKDLQIQKIQEEVAKKLGLDGSKDWCQKDEEQKACDIFNALQRKKFVLLLDDIWAKVDLAKIGIPFPDRVNGSKVVFTTRSQEVCGRMGVDVQMEVHCLTPEDALDLFQKKIGAITLGSHPDIPELAKIVAKKCYGLPLALNVIGETMSCKRTKQEWHHAIDVLTSNTTKFSGMEDEILPILKYSYDNLKGDQVQSCLLYCALFPEDGRISKMDLIEYLICEGIIDGSEDMKKAENEGYEIIGRLVCSSLLMEEDKFKVYMHDVVREMALWIASDFGKQKDNILVHAGVGLYEMPKFKNWNAVKRVSLMDNKIDRISGSMDCFQLTTLFLQRNEVLNNISSEFFKSMPRLVVLDVSNNKSLFKFPDEISELVSLKYLNMSSTSIISLPVGLQELKNLIHLALEWTYRLSIVRVSALLNLKVLKLQHSGFVLGSETKEELQVLEHLEILTIDIKSVSGLDEFFSSRKLMSCTQELTIEECQLQSSHVWRLSSMEKLHALHLERCTISKIYMDTANIRRENSKNEFFLSLSKVNIKYCEYTKELTWLMFAANLTELVIEGGIQLVEIINKEKACEGLHSGIVPFQKLKTLHLKVLPMLYNIIWKPLPFPCLTDLKIDYCFNLRKLPLDSKSGDRGLVLTHTEEDWLERVQWEDEATKTRFLASSRMIQAFFY